MPGSWGRGGGRTTLPAKLHEYSGELIGRAAKSRGRARLAEGRRGGSALLAGCSSGSGGTEDIFETTVIAHARRAERGAGGREKRGAVRAQGCGSGGPGRGRGESRPQTGGRSVDSLARGCLVWAFDAGCLRARLAYGALRALGGDAGVRVLRIV